jgi:hypothetical protein
LRINHADELSAFGHRPLDGIVGPHALPCQLDAILRLERPSRAREERMEPRGILLGPTGTGFRSKSIGFIHG